MLPTDEEPVLLFAIIAYGSVALALVGLMALFGELAGTAIGAATLIAWGIYERVKTGYWP